jgi:putative heme-binding domain-containing protein
LLAASAADGAAPLYGRVAAIFTLKQLDGVDSHATLLDLVNDAKVREFALRALTDRATQLDGVPLEPFRAALHDADPRVRAQAVISLGRLGRPAAAEALLPLTARPDGSELPAKTPLHAQPDADRVIPHLAVRALVALGAIDACLGALEGPYRDGALRALRCLHDERTIDGLLSHLAHERNTTERQQLLAALVRLYHREGDYDGRDWWGTRPDTTGPYYDRQTWSQSERIAGVVRAAIQESKGTASEALVAVLARHKVRLDGIDVPASANAGEPQVAIAVPQADPSNPNLLANLAYDAALDRALKSAGDAARGRQLYTQQSCAACHTDADGQTPKGPHLVDIGKRYKREELIESLLKPSAKIAQGFDSWVFLTTDGSVHEGFVARESAESLHVRRINGLSLELLKSDIEERKKLDQSMMPTGIVGNLTPEQLADLLAYLDSLRSP